MSEASVKEIKSILMQEDVVESEVLPQLLGEDRFKDITAAEIAEILEWSGDNEYVTVDDIISEASKYGYMSTNEREVSFSEGGIINFTKDKYEECISQIKSEDVVGSLDGEMIGSLYQGALCCEAILYFDDKNDKYYIGGNFYVIDPEGDYGELNGINTEFCDGFGVDIENTYEKTLNSFINAYEHCVNDESYNKCRGVDNYLTNAAENRSLTWEGQLNLQTTTEYVLVSQGFVIGRYDNKYEAEAIMKRENEDNYKYQQEAIDNGEAYADNEIFMYEERVLTCVENEPMQKDNSKVDYNSFVDYSVESTVQRLLGCAYENEMVSVAKDDVLFQTLLNEIVDAHNKFDNDNMEYLDGEELVFPTLLTEKVKEGGSKELPDIMCDVIYDAYKYFINGEDISNNLPEPKPMLIKNSPVKLEINLDYDGPHPTIEYKGKTVEYEKAGDATKLIEQALKEKDDLSR